MSLKIDRMQLEIVINNDQARKSLRQLDDEAKRLKRELRKVPEGSEEYKRITTRLKEIQLQHDGIIEKMGIQKLTLRELGQRQKELNAIMRNLDPSTKAYRDLEKQLIAIKNRQAELRVQTNQTGLSLKKLADGFNKYLAIVTAGIATFAGAIMAGRRAIQTYAEFDDKVADVMKTTNLTKEQVYAMNEEFKKIDTRTAQDELLDLAWVAGKLGITGQEDIMGFVRAADKINVALKKDLGGSTEEALRQIGKLVDVFKLKELYGIEDAMLKVGSAINELGMASTANEAYLVEFSKRAAGIAPLANVSIPNILGLAATLDQLGQTSETSSTVYTMVMSKMVSKTESFARIAGSSVEDFSNLIRTDANEAFLQLLEGLNGNADGMEMLVQNLGDISLEGRRSTGVLGALANNTEMLREQQTLANEAFVDGSSVITEFNIKNENAQAILEKKRKILRNLTIELGEKLMPILTVSTSAFSYFVRTLLAAPRIYRENKTEITLLVGALLMLYSTQIKLLALSLLQNLTLQGGLALRAKEAIQLRLLLIQEQYRLALIGRTTLATKAAAIATTTWSQALKLIGGPVGLAIGAFTAYVALMQKYSRGAREARELEIQKNIALDESKAIYESLSETTEKYRDLQNQLNVLSVERKQNLREEIEAELDKAMSSLYLVQAKKEEVEADNARLSMWKIMTKSFLLMFKGETEAIEGLQELQKQAQENGKKAASEFDIHIQNIIDKIDQFRQGLQVVTNNLEAERLGDEIFAETISQLQEKLNQYRIALNNSKIGSEDYQRISGKLTETQKELNAALSAGNQTLDETVNAYDALTKKISEAQSQLAHYVTLGDTVSAQAWFQILRGLMAQKYVLDQLIAAGGDMQKMLADFRTEMLSGGDKIIKSIDDDIWKTISEATGELGKEAMEAVKQATELSLSGGEAYNAAHAARMAKIDEWKNAAIDSAAAIANASLDIVKNNIQHETNERINALNKQKNAELNSRKLTAKQREAIEEKYRQKEAKIKEEAFRKQKAASIIQSLINTAVAVTAALPNVALAVATGIAGLAQTAVIAAQKVPTFEQGNVQEVLGQNGRKYRAQVTNQKHKSGLFNKPTFVPGFGLFGETVDPELVFNPQDTKVIMNSPALIAAIRHTLGGVQQFAQGNAREIIRETNNTVNSTMDPETKELLQLLKKRLDEPPVAYLLANEDYMRKHMEIEEKYSGFKNQ